MMFSETHVGALLSSRTVLYLLLPVSRYERIELKFEYEGLDIFIGIVWVPRSVAFWIALSLSAEVPT